MATKDEIKSLLEAEIGPLKAKLTSIEKSFFELNKIFGRTYRWHAVMETSGVLFMYSNF